MAFSGPPFPDTPVNTTTAAEQTHAAIAGLADGGHVVTWTSAGQDGSGSGIYMQRFDADGEPVGSETLVNTTTANDQGFSSVAALTGGGFVVTWTSVGQDGSFGGIYMQRFSGNGNPRGSETLVNTNTTGSQSDAKVIALSTGGFAVVWSDFDGTTTVRMQLYDASGGPVGGEVTVATGSVDVDPIWPVVAEMDSGRLVVGWSNSNFGALEDDPYFQLVNADGTLQGGPTQMNTTPGTHANQTQVVALEGGGFMAVWTESIGQTGAVGVGDGRIVGRIWRNNGQPLTDEFTVSDSTTGRRFGVQATLGGDGNVYVGWTEELVPGEVFVMRAVDPSGDLVGDQFYVSDMVPQSGLNRFLDLATLENGDVVAAWQSWFGTSDIVTRHIFTDREDARATDADDTVGLADGGDTLDALDGNDSIGGGDGDDVIFGNDGEDTLDGDVGADFLDGADGSDTVLGGSGDDSVKGGDGQDLLEGGSGADILLGEEGSDTLNGDGGTDSMQGGGGSDDLYGGTDDDTIWGDHNTTQVWTDGSGGADALYGGDGDDLMYGGSKDDTLEGGAGNDTMYGDGLFGDDLETGDDTFVLSAGDDIFNGADGSDTFDVSAATSAMTVTMEAFGSALGVYSGAYSGSFYYIENVNGSAFDDVITGKGDDNFFVGNDGDDMLDGGGGADTMYGSDGADTVLGGDGEDGIEGGDGADSMDGGRNADVLVGGGGRDTLTGGTGDDLFVFRLDGGKDTVTDFAQGKDAVALDDDLWGGGMTLQDVLDTYGSLSANGKKFTLDFGGNDILTLKGGSFDLGTLAADFYVD
jgi:Ca2+-binding RTX toxin-like protein